MRLTATMIGVCSVLLTTGACSARRAAAPHGGIATQPAWSAPTANTLSRALLDHSLALGRRYLLNVQDPVGGFLYEYDFVRKVYGAGDNPVRQAGTLWGLALIHQDAPSKETARAVAQGLAFFQRHSRTTPSGARYVVYPGQRYGRTGAVALVSLALIEFLRTEKDLAGLAGYERTLDQYLGFLLSLRTKEGQFRRNYRHKTGEGFGKPMPYYDGETLLALVKAAKYLGRAQMKDMILESAETMYRRYVQDALPREPDGPLTKAFYQWSSMAFYEIYTANWTGSAPYARRVIDLGHWVIDIHKVQGSSANTGYAYEGLVTAWETARLTSNRGAMEKFGRVIDAELYRLLSMQVGNPLQNKFLQAHKTDDPLAVGGVINGAANPRLRIDVAQHQMHAIILARRHIYH